MKVERKQVKAMFEAAGWTTAGSWGDERINEKIEKINELNVEVPEDETLAKLMKAIQKAVKNGEAVELTDKAPKAEGRLSPENKKLKAEFEEAAAEPKAKKAEGKKKSTPTDSDTSAATVTSAVTDPETSEGDEEEEEIAERAPVGWRLTSAVVAEVTPKLAKDFAEMEATLIERTFKQKKVDYYLELLLNNEFAPCRFASAYCKEDKKTYRVNGQHCSKMFVAAGELGKENLKGQKVYVEEYECETLADVAQLFGTFDSKEQARSSADITHAVSQTIDKVKDLDAKLVNLAVGAINYAMGPTNQGGGRHVTAAERANVLYDCDNFVVWMKTTLGDKKTDDNRDLWRVPVIAAMFQTYQSNKNEAKTFWRAVRDETGEKPELPDRKLAKFLRSLPAAGGRGSGTPQAEKVVPKTIYGVSVTAWNMWKAGQTGNLKFKNTDEFPEVA